MKRTLKVFESPSENQMPSFRAEKPTMLIKTKFEEKSLKQISKIRSAIKQGIMIGRIKSHEALE